MLGPCDLVLRPLLPTNPKLSFARQLRAPPLRWHFCFTAALVAQLHRIAGLRRALPPTRVRRAAGAGVRIADGWLGRSAPL